MVIFGKILALKIMQENLGRKVTRLIFAKKPSDFLDTFDWMMFEIFVEIVTFLTRIIKSCHILQLVF